LLRSRNWRAKGRRCLGLILGLLPGFIGWSITASIPASEERKIRCSSATGKVEVTWLQTPSFTQS
jgi:hypothetical protein